jgi:hypothetical protein
VTGARPHSRRRENEEGERGAAVLLGSTAWSRGGPWWRHTARMCGRGGGRGSRSIGERRRPVAAQGQRARAVWRGHVVWPARQAGPGTQCRATAPADRRPRAHSAGWRGSNRI